MSEHFGEVGGAGMKNKETSLGLEEFLEFNLLRQNKST